MAYHQRSSRPSYRPTKMTYFIDATNVCYWEDRAHCSLRPLLQLLITLLKRRQRFYCIFDANTAYKLDEHEQGYYQELLEHANFFHQVTGGKRADDYLLSLANAENGGVISNDNYRESRFHWLDRDHHPQRLFMGEVIPSTRGGQRLMLIDLDINEPLNTDVEELLELFMDMIKPKPKKTYRGVISKFTPLPHGGGWGFINYEETRKTSIYFSLNEGDLNQVTEGQEIEFIIGENERGPCARNINLASPVNVPDPVAGDEVTDNGDKSMSGRLEDMRQLLQSAQLRYMEKEKEIQRLEQLNRYSSQFLQTPDGMSIGVVVNYNPERELGNIKIGPTKETIFFYKSYFSDPNAFIRVGQKVIFELGENKQGTVAYNIKQWEPFQAQASGSALATSAGQYEDGYASPGHHRDPYGEPSGYQSHQEHGRGGLDYEAEDELYRLRDELRYYKQFLIPPEDMYYGVVVNYNAERELGNIKIGPGKETVFFYKSYFANPSLRIEVGLKVMFTLGRNKQGEVAHNIHIWDPFRKNYDSRYGGSSFNRFADNRMRLQINDLRAANNQLQRTLEEQDRLAVALESHDDEAIQTEITALKERLEEALQAKYDQYAPSGAPTTEDGSALDASASSYEDGETADYSEHTTDADSDSANADQNWEDGAPDEDTFYSSDTGSEGAAEQELDASDETDSDTEVETAAVEEEMEPAATEDKAKHQEIEIDDEHPSVAYGQQQEEEPEPIYEPEDTQEASDAQEEEDYEENYPRKIPPSPVDTSDRVAWWEGLEPQWQIAFNKIVGNEQSKDIPSNKQLESIFDLIEIDFVKKTELSFKITNLSGLTGLTQLMMLNVSGQRLESLDGLNYLDKLERLTAKQNALTDLSGLNPTSIKKIDLMDNPSLGNLLSLAEELPELQELSLRKCKLTTLRGLPKAPKLKKLDISVNKLTKVSAFDDQPNLNFLNLSKNPLESCESFAGLPLKELRVAETKLKESHLDDLPETLKKLDMRKLEIDSDFINELSAVYGKDLKA